MSQVTQHLDHIAEVLKHDIDHDHLMRPELHAVLDEMRMSFDHQDSDGALNTLVRGALKLRVSDVHLEVYEHDAIVRFRIDGDLNKLGVITTREHNMLVERMKYRSNLKLNIHDVPQDGKFRFGTEGHDSEIDVRVSVIPTRYGESIVCRILDSTTNILTMESLGILGPQSEIITQALKKKQGMILVTGPTGSGKTTTLYTMIHALHRPENKIITLEDPIEYQIPGVLQSEINERTGYTFAMGVRSILRHDPDIIMIGEIRDLDTAMTAVQASLTGHLVLSTLHTKSAMETLERLENLGLSPYDLAASVDVIIAQRLVRKVCHHCSERTQVPLEKDEANLLKKYGVKESLAQSGRGCDQCGFTGYLGRVGIYEVLSVSSTLREMIRKNSAQGDMVKVAYEEGFLSLVDDARAKIHLGMTTEAECMRNGIL